MVTASSVVSAIGTSLGCSPGSKILPGVPMCCYTDRSEDLRFFVSLV